MSASLVSSAISAICRESLGAFFEGYCWIKQKAGAFVEGLPMHEYQRQLEEVQQWCRENNKPCRIAAIKPRRAGSSTFAVASMHHFLTWNAGRSGCVMGGSDYQGENLFNMLRLMASRDRTVKQKANVLDKNARYPNGSTAVRINASNENAGLSGGYDFMVVTELAKWDEDGVAAAPDVLSGALKCVPFLPGTTIIIESTAEGLNEMHRIYSTGISLEELKAGKIGYVKIFCPWFSFKDHVLEPEVMGLGGMDQLSSDERDIVAKYQLSLSQASWMRYTIKDQCKSDFENFKENYPFDDVSCFLLSGRKAFSARGLELMRKDSVRYPYSTGIIDLVKQRTEDTVSWRVAGPDSCQVMRWEQPRDGMKYLIAVDPMTGASQTAGADPDNHGVIVWRAGYFENAVWYPPRVVAHLVDDLDLWNTKREYALRWDIDVLEERVWRLALYYGNCLIVPEMNMDRGLVELLKLRNKANIITRPVFNRREQTEQNQLGWLTTEQTRGKIIADMQTGVREYANYDTLTGPSHERVEIFSPVILGEMETFIVKQNGRCEAMQGKHDDLVLSLAFGHSSLSHATTYRRPGGVHLDPWDIVDKSAKTSSYS